MNLQLTTVSREAAIRMRARNAELNSINVHIFVKKNIISECKWYGEVLCDGAVVQVGAIVSPNFQSSHYAQDLYRWWFLLKCSKSKMSVVSRSWLDVNSDKRFRSSKI